METEQTKRTIDEILSSAASRPYRERAEKAEAELSRLRNSHTALVEALRTMTERYVSLVNCGDCGNWDPEVEPEVIEARRALSAEGEKEAPKTLVDGISDADWDNWDASDENPNVADSDGIEDAPKDEPYCHVIEHPGWFDANSGTGEPASTQFLDKPAVGSFPLYRRAR